MHSALSVKSVLATRAAKLMAAAIIVLAIAPFTRPFCAFNGADITPDQVLHSAGAELKIAQDATDVDCSIPNDSPIAFYTALNTPLLPGGRQVHSIRALVLRI